MAKVGIVGASGYTGAELLRLLAAHPELDVVVATGDSQAGQPIAGLYPSLTGAYADRVFDRWDPDLVDGLQRLPEIVLCLAREADDQVGREGEVRNRAA